MGLLDNERERTNVPDDRVDYSIIGLKDMESIDNTTNELITQLSRTESVLSNYAACAEEIESIVDYELVDGEEYIPQDLAERTVAMGDSLDLPILLDNRRKMDVEDFTFYTNTGGLGTVPLQRSLEDKLVAASNTINDLVKVLTLKRAGQNKLASLYNVVATSERYQDALFTTPVTVTVSGASKEDFISGSAGNAASKVYEKSVKVLANIVSSRTDEEVINALRDIEHSTLDDKGVLVIKGERITATLNCDPTGFTSDIVNTSPSSTTIDLDGMDTESAEAVIRKMDLNKVSAYKEGTISTECISVPSKVVSACTFVIREYLIPSTETINHQLRIVRGVLCKNTEIASNLR